MNSTATTRSPIAAVPFSAATAEPDVVFSALSAQAPTLPAVFIADCSSVFEQLCVYPHRVIASAVPPPAYTNGSQHLAFEYTPERRELNLLPP